MEAILKIAISTKQSGRLEFADGSAGTLCANGAASLSSTLAGGKKLPAWPHAPIIVDAWLLSIPVETTPMYEGERVKVRCFLPAISRRLHFKARSLLLFGESCKYSCYLASLLFWKDGLCSTFYVVTPPIQLSSTCPLHSAYVWIPMVF